jgi:hypothetical protein
MTGTSSSLESIIADTRLVPEGRSQRSLARDCARNPLTHQVYERPGAAFLSVFCGAYSQSHRERIP